jgi:hypothetical protein
LQNQYDTIHCLRSVEADGLKHLNRGVSVKCVNNILHYERGIQLFGDTSSFQVPFKSSINILIIKLDISDQIIDLFFVISSLLNAALSPGFGLLYIIEIILTFCQAIVSIGILEIHHMSLVVIMQGILEFFILFIEFSYS